MQIFIRDGPRFIAGLFVLRRTKFRRFAPLIFITTIQRTDAARLDEITIAYSNVNCTWQFDVANVTRCCVYFIVRSIFFFPFSILSRCADDGVRMTTVQREHIRRLSVLWKEVSASIKQSFLSTWA